MLSLPEVAGLLRLHTNTIRAWVRQGKLIPIKMGKEQVDMFHKAEVDQLKESLQQHGIVVKDVHQAFPVVGIGASAGGLEAMGQLLSKLPTDLGLAYILVSHMEENGEHTIAELLQRKTSIPVQVAENGMLLHPDRLYVGPAGMQIAVVNNTITLQRCGKAPVATIRPIDALFRALANEYQNNAIGIILSGGGMDGTQGLRAIKAEDGLTIAQDASAQDQAMPQNAQEAGVVDLVLAPQAIGPQLADLVKRLFPNGDTRLPAKHENELRRILQLLFEERGVDFTQYKETTIHRRIIRRMVLSKCNKLSEYLKLLREVPNEVETLYSELLINVTSFFRDPAFHKALTERVFPDLFKDRAGNDTLRIWVSACAGGEEVVSIAITLSEFLRANAINTTVQIFATDLNERTIEKARLGIYKKSALQDMDPERLRQFFQHVDGHFQVIKSIRDMCVFAKHDLLKDPPFSHVDLISCQNVLIYLDNGAQGRILKNFHYALKPDGVLALGNSETTANAPELFLQPEREYKVYVKKSTGKQRLQLDMRYKPSPVHDAQHLRPVGIPRGAVAGNDVDREVEQLLLNRYVPACVLVDRQLDIQRFIGPTAQFIRPRSGRASLNLLKMVRDDLAFEVRTLVQRARKENVPTRKNGIPVKLDDVLQEVSVEVVPMGGARDPHFLVLFRQEGQPTPIVGSASKRTSKSSDAKDKRIALLEQELVEAREQSRLISEESEVGTQELQAANEEVVSSNEELQSINEELETSKEELQSINEEYATINEELQMRNDALAESEERYRRLIDLMPVAVYTCDVNGHVRLFNEAAVRLWGRKPVLGETLWSGSASLRAADGSELPLDLSPMAIAIREERALKDIEIVVVRPGGEQRAVLSNPTPLYDTQGRINGAINVLVDITERAENERRLDLATKVGNLGIWDWDIIGDEITWTDAVYAIHGVEKGSFVPTMNGYHELIHPEDRDRVGAAIKATLEKDTPYEIEFRTLNKKGEVNWVYTSAVVVRDGGRPVRMLGGTMNITERRVAEERVRVLGARLDQALDSADLGTWNIDGKVEGMNVDERFKTIFGWKDATISVEQAFEVVHPDDRERVAKAIQGATRPVNTQPYEIEYRVVHPDGSNHWVLAKGRSTFTEGSDGRELLSFDGTVLDITDRKRAEEARQQLSGMLERSLNEIYIFDLDGLKFEYVNRGALRNLGYTLEQMRDMTPLDIKPEMNAHQFDDLVKPLRTGEKEMIEFNTAHRRADGSSYPVEVHLQIVNNGLRRSFLAMILDITERKLDEERLRVVTGTGKLGIWDWDIVADAITWTDPVYQIHGVEKGAFVPTMNGYTELIHPDDRAMVYAAIKAALEEDAPYEVEFRTLNAEGVVNWVFTSAVVMREDGRPVRMMGGTMNITQRKEAEEAAQRLAAIVESSEDAIIAVDLTGIVTDWNEGAVKLFGYPEEEVLGNPIQMLLPDDRKEEEIELLGRVAKGERVEHFETKRQRKDGSLVDVALSLSAIRDEQGVIIGAAKIARDITIAARAEEELRASEQRFHLLADNVSQLIWMAEPDGSTMWFNNRWHEFTGMTSDEIRANSKSLHHPDHYDRATNSLNERAAQGEPWNDVFPLKGADGEYHWFLANAMPVKDEDGNVVRWFGTCTDITDQRVAQEKMRESEERFRLLADNIGQLAWIAEPNGDIHWYNKRWFDYSGTTPEEMDGWGWTKIQHPDHVERVTHKFKRHIDEGVDWEDIFPIKGADDEYRWFLSRAFPVRDATGRIVRWFGTNTDISDRKAMEDELAAIAINKDNFLATLAHELRGPLAPLKNGLQLLEMAADDPSAQENTRNMMVRQLDHMVRLVDDLMDLSRINTGKIKLSLDEVDICDVVATAMETSRPLIDRNGHTLKVELAEEKLVVNGDRDRLVQVVANLLTNAAKYTPPGGMVDVVVKRKGEEVSIVVKDNGIGIAAEKISSVFDMFTQVDPHQKTESGGGLGIGLNIVQRIMEMHNGAVEARSEGLGKGSEFSLRIPRLLGKVVQPAPTKPTTEQGGTRRVMVVDDNEDAALSMSMILKKRGHVIAVAHDGEMAVAKGAEFKPEIVIMDIGMPKMNGYEACAAMRKTDWGQRCMIVALSGWGQEEDRQKSKEAGFDRHVVKPIDRATLEWIVTQEKE